MVSLKKGQTEIVGLVIVVIILVILALIFLKFYITGNGDKDSSVKSVQANNLVNAIKMVTMCNQNIGDAIIACCNNNDFCGGDACRLSIEEIKKIMDSSSEEIIYFEAKDNDDLCLSVNNDCNGVSSSINFIRNNDGEAQIQVKICSIK